MAIRIDPSEMRGIASQFGSTMADLNTLINKMQGLTDTLVSGWEGQASKGYQDRFAKIKDNFTTQMVPLVDEIVKNLNTVADEMEDFDTKLGTQFRG